MILIFLQMSLSDYLPATNSQLDSNKDKLSIGEQKYIKQWKTKCSYGIIYILNFRAGWNVLGFLYI